jgi:DNA binding domain, excisionase family
MTEKNKKKTAELNDLKLYTLTEIETVLGVTHRTLLTYVTTGKLKATKIGGRWKVTKSALKEFIDAGNGTPKY